MLSQEVDLNSGIITGDTGTYSVTYWVHNGFQVCDDVGGVSDQKLGDVEWWVCVESDAYVTSFH